MPKRARRICSYPGCTQVVSKGRCVIHKGSPARRPDTRPNSTRRGYGYKWQRVRGAYLAAHPLCADPHKRHEGVVVVATEVHHITPRSQGGTNRWDNLQALCKPCHSHHTFTIEQQGKMRKGGR